MRIYQTIITRYHGATNVRGARYSATCTAGKRVYIKLDPDWDNDDRGHIVARDRLKGKLNWPGKMVTGAIKGGMVHVFTD